MQDVFDAFLMTVKVTLGVIVHALFMVPLGAICLVFAVGLLPIDLFVYALTLGGVKFEIFWAFGGAAQTLFKWYGNKAKKWRKQIGE